MDRTGERFAAALPETETEQRCAAARAPLGDHGQVRCVAVVPAGTDNALLLRLEVAVRDAPEATAGVTLRGEATAVRPRCGVFVGSTAKADES